MSRLRENANTRRILGPPPVLGIHHATVLLDALGELSRGIEQGREPWINYDDDPDDPKATKDGYQRLIRDAQKALGYQLAYDGQATIIRGQDVPNVALIDLNEIVRLLREEHGIADARIEPGDRDSVKVVARDTAALYGWYDGEGNTDPIADVEDFWVGPNTDEDGRFLRESEAVTADDEVAIAKHIASRAHGDQYLHGKSAVVFTFTGQDLSTHDVRFDLPDERSFDELQRTAIERCWNDKGDTWMASITHTVID